MNLKGKLKEDFEEWVCANDTALHYGGGCPHITDIFSELPLSMQFALLCDFLEKEGNVVVWTEPHEDFYQLTVYGFSLESKIIGDINKEEAIEKAIEYLNSNYEH